MEMIKAFFIMVNINYQSYGEKLNLRLRLYSDGETKYICVNKLLKGKLLKRHWNQKKQCFIPSAPYSEENNKALTTFKKQFEERAENWNGSLSSLVLEVNSLDKIELSSDKNVTFLHGKPTMQYLIRIIVSELKNNKHADGTLKGTFEHYEKIEKRLQEFCSFAHIDYSTLLVEDINPFFVRSIFNWVNTKRDGKGLLYISKLLHATLRRAEQMGWFDMDSVKHVDWKKKSRISQQKNFTLTDEQVKKFVSMRISELPRAKNARLYRDFCVFILCTGQSPCDAISLKYSDIQTINGKQHFVFRRRKISERQPIPCAVPISNEMKEIMKRQKLKAKDGYVFPIRNKKKLAEQRTNNGDIKKFIYMLNCWLKKVGVLLGCNFPLHTYTFRHTAITRLLRNEVPVIYVSQMMGTSVENCEKIYYNNLADKESMNKVLKLGL